MPARAEPLARVLVVDDEAALVAALCDTLNDLRYEAHGFTSAREALAALRESPYDILLTDLSMPEMDGVILLRAALDIEPELVGIIMTGQGTVRTAVEAMKTGAHDYILKPFKLNALVPVIARAAQVHRLKSENIQLRAMLSIYELSAAAAFALDAERMLNEVVVAALRQSRHVETAILLAGEDTRELRLARARAVSWKTPIGATFPFDARLSAWIAQCREMVSDAAPEKLSALATAHPFQAEFGGVALPMIAQGRLVGVLLFRKTEGRPATPGEMKALRVLAGIGAAALAATQLHAQIRDAEERYRAMFDSNPIPTWVAELDPQRIVAVNEAAVRDYGWSREEFFGMVASDLWLPEDQEPLRALIAERRRRPGPPQPYRGQWRHRRKNGEIFDVVVEARPIQFGGRECRILTAVDISERLAAEARLSALSHRVLEVQETERREVARELHDEIGQALTAVKLGLEALRRAPGSRVDPAAFADSVELVEHALQQVRSLTLDLRPTVLDDLGLAAALRWLVERQQRLTGVRVVAAIDLPATRFDPAIETACFRIAQEAITNSLRHALAQTISLSTRCEDGALRLTVTDDGAGFDLAAARSAGAAGHSTGLAGMEERARLGGGQLEVLTARGGGTEVRARFALDGGA